MAIAPAIDQNRASLAGIELTGKESIDWSLRAGVRPEIRRFAVPEFQVDDFMEKAGGAVELKFTHSDGTQETFRNLWIIGVEPHESPLWFNIVVADRRWFWQRKHVLRRFNMRKVVGYQRVTRIDTLELQPVEPRFAYWAWSLKDPDNLKKWEAMDVLLNVLGAAFSVEHDFYGEVPTTVRFLAEGKLNQSSIENLEIDDPADQAVSRALSFLPDLSLYLDADGKVVLNHKSAMRDLIEAKKILPEIRGAGHIAHVSRRFQMPAFVRVLFTYEAEVRFDFIEQPGTLEADARIGENMIPVPDFQATINGKVVPQGTWVTLDSYLDYLATQSPPGIGTMTKADWYRILREAAIPFNDLWAALELTGSIDPDADWSARVSALQQHFRRTYQIPKRWVDRALAIQAFRVATNNPTSGTREQAGAWGNYSTIGTQRFFEKQIRAGLKDAVFAINVTGYPAGPTVGGVPSFDSDTKQAPIKVTVVDQDQGIITFDYQIDVHRVFEQVLPSHIDGPVGAVVADESLQRTIPGQSAKAYQLTFNGMVEGTDDPPRLDATHKVACVLTLVPAGPNDSRQLHAIDIIPSDVASLLPAEMATSLNAASGPPIEVRVGMNVERARVAWPNDDRYKQIEALFGVPKAGPRPNIDDLIVNLDATGAAANNAASINAIAKAVAARTFSRYADRFMGSAATRLTPGVNPAGWATEATYSLAPDGTMTTSLSFPDDQELLDFLSILDPQSRAVILREVTGMN